jgi:peptidoglycan hydrolase-like protein with peptidoglycan-binding domain
MPGIYDELKDNQDDLRGAEPQDPYVDAMPSALSNELASLFPEPSAPARIESLMRQYPDQTNQILAEAARRCGNAAVQRALQLHQANAGTQADTNAELNAGLDGGAPSAPTAASAANAAALSTEVESSSMWNAANAYNAAHPHHVTEFNALTDGFAMRDGKVDAEKIANWQYDHGLEADGKIGPKTVAVAKKEAAAPKAAEPDIAPSPDQPDEELVDSEGTPYSKLAE